MLERSMLKVNMYMQNVQNETMDIGEVYTEVYKLRRYFKKFNPNNADEVMQKAVMHIISHYDGNYAIEPYIKALARSMGKDNGRIIPYEDMELVMSNKQTFSDFSSDIINELMESTEAKGIIDIVLSYMNYFLLLGSLIEDCLKQGNDIKDTIKDSTKYFPKQFAQDCLKACKKCKNFLPICMNIYRDNKENIKRFISMGTSNSDWQEANYKTIDEFTSRRYQFLNADGLPVLNPDSETLYINKKLQGKRIVRINYVDTWDLMCEYLSSDEKVNPMKYEINNRCIYRTLGGSISTVNADINQIFDLCLNEILTNLLLNIRGKIIGRGLRYFYFIINKGVNIDIPVFEAYGITLHFIAEDITDSILYMGR